MKILMVCLGNICRSPLAEGIMKHKISQFGLDWTVDSAGTGAWHKGESPDLRSIEVAKNHGLDISDQKARQFRDSDFKEFDLILAMDSSNYMDLITKSEIEDEKSKVNLIMNYKDAGMNENVPDPYWNDNGFIKVYNMLDIACQKVIEAYT